MQILWLQKALTSRMKIKLVEKASSLVSKHHRTHVKSISWAGSWLDRVWEQASCSEWGTLGSHQLDAFNCNVLNT